MPKKKKEIQETIETVQQIVERQNSANEDSRVYAILNSMKSGLEMTLKVVNDNIQGLRKDMSDSIQNFNNVRNEIKDLTEAMTEQSLKQNIFNAKMEHVVSQLQEDVFKLTENSCSSEMISACKEITRVLPEIKDITTEYKKRKIEEEKKNKKHKEIKEEIIKEAGKKIAGIPAAFLQDVLKLLGVAGITYLIALFTNHH